MAALLGMGQERDYTMSGRIFGRRSGSEQGDARKRRASPQNLLRSVADFDRQTGDAPII